MRPALLTPMRLLSAIVAFTIICMLAVAAVTDHLADICFSGNTFSQTSRVHLINDVTRSLKRAQDARREYLATGNTAYLYAYNTACGDVDASMDRLVNEDYEVTNKLAHAEGLRQIVHTKLTEIGKSLESKPAVQSLAATPSADGDLARIERLLDSLAKEESSDISGQLEDAQARTIFHRNLVTALAIINVLFLTGVGFCAIQIGKLHSLITMCAWSKRVQYQDKWVPLEEYIKNRFGVRISHGISQEEYDKWSASEIASEARPAPPASRPEPKAAA